MNDQNEISKDLRRSARQTKRTDYKEFNQTGVIKEVQFLNDPVATDDEDILTTRVYQITKDVLLTMI